MSTDEQSQSYSVFEYLVGVTVLTMNNQLQSFARQTLKDGLNQLPTGWQRKFALMYGRQGGRRSVVDCEAMPMSDVIAEIPDDKLDWAMEQVNNSLKKQRKALEEP